jgi:hypothetical protein
MSSATEEASVPETDLQTGRFRQRQRTRAAIVNATAELLRSGRTTPGASEIAEAADVYRRTVYQYFPDRRPAPARRHPGPAQPVPDDERVGRVRPPTLAVGKGRRAGVSRQDPQSGR